MKGYLSKRDASCGRILNAILFLASYKRSQEGTSQAATASDASPRQQPPASPEQWPVVASQHLRSPLLSSDASDRQRPATASCSCHPPSHRDDDKRVPKKAGKGALADGAIEFLIARRAGRETLLLLLVTLATLVVAKVDPMR